MMMMGVGCVEGLGCCVCLGGVCEREFAAEAKSLIPDNLLGLFLRRKPSAIPPRPPFNLMLPSLVLPPLI